MLRVLLKFFTAFMLVAVPSVFSATVYLDPVNGNDDNGGVLESEPVKSFERARALANGGIVYLMKTLTVTEDSVFDLDGGILRRYISTDGTITNTAVLISSSTAGISLSFSNITVEGIGTESYVSGCLLSASKANVNIGLNATFQKSYTITVPAGISCANLTMSDNAKITWCRIDTAAKHIVGAAAAQVSGLLKMSGTSSICNNTNVCLYTSSINGLRPVAGACAGYFEMSDRSTIKQNISRTRGYSNYISIGGAGLYISGSNTSVMRDFASVSENTSSSQRGGGIYLNSGTLIMMDDSSLVSNSASYTPISMGHGQAIFAASSATLIMSNRASVVYNGINARGSRHDSGDGSVTVGYLYMHDDSSVVSNYADTAGGVRINAGGGMFDRSRIAYNKIKYHNHQSFEGGLLVAGGEFSMNDDAVIEGHTDSAAISGGVGVYGSGRFVMNSGTIRGNNGGILISACVKGGTAVINGGFITNNASFGIQNGSIPYTGYYRVGGRLFLNGGVIGYNTGYGITDLGNCASTNYYRGGMTVGNTKGGVRVYNAATCAYIGGNPRFDDFFYSQRPSFSFLVDERMRFGANIPMVFTALDSKNREIASLTAANGFGLDMNQDGSMEPQIVALPSGRIMNAARYSKYFSVENKFTDPSVKRYMNDVGEGRMGFSLYPFSGHTLLFMK